MTQYKIVQLQRNLPDGVVTISHWTATKTDGEFTASTYGSIGLPAKDLRDSTFVVYSDITEAQSVSWTKAAMGSKAVAELEAGLDAQIEAKKNPKQASGTPWVVANNVFLNTQSEQR